MFRVHSRAVATLVEGFSIFICAERISVPVPLPFRAMYFFGYKICQLSLKNRILAPMILHSNFHVRMEVLELTAENSKQALLTLLYSH